MVVAINCRHAHEHCSCLLGKYCCTKNCWCPAAGLLRWVSTNMPSVTPAQVAWVPGSSAAAGAAGKGPRNGPTQTLSSLRDMQNTIYSGAIIQIFVGCSTMIKRRGFQRMHSLCDFLSPTVSTPYLQYLVIARSKIIVIWGLQVQNSSSFSNWESFMVLQSITGTWRITQKPGGDKLLLPQASFQLS